MPAFITRNATRDGMGPILQNGIEGFVAEPDIQLAEGALIANLKLIEGVAATYPDERQFLVMAAMARANYAFGFVADELEAVRFAYPGDSARADPLLARAQASFAIGQTHAERALAFNDDWSEIMAGRPLAEVPLDDFTRGLAALEREDAPALFWLAFNWGGRLQAVLDPAEATQLPKIERMAARMLELDERFFYGLGPHLLAGTLHGFRSPALGGAPDKAKLHFDRAAELGGGALLPRVMKAQFVFAQTEDQAGFEQTLRSVLDTEAVPDRALLDAIAHKKACRLLANADELFLTDEITTLPDRCGRIAHSHPLRAAD